MANSLKYQGFDNINEGQLSKQSKKSVPKVDPRSNGDPAGIRTPYKNLYKYCGSKDNSISCAISCAIYEIVKEISICKIQKQ